MIINDFIEKANLVHGSRYDYSNVNYVNAHTKIDIVCKEHGVFKQTPNNHLKGQNCPMCYGNKKLTLSDFIIKANEIHNNRYDYSLVDYTNAKDKVKIVCKEHGVFEQNPDNHIRKKYGCPICKKLSTGNRCRKTKDQFVLESKKIHNNKYDYSLVDYVDNKTKVKIICREHGVFEQKPYHHLSNVGCPKCNHSRGESMIERYLLENNIQYVEQKTFIECRHKKLLPFDFYLPEYNICIEYDGEQHYNPKEHFGGIAYLKLQQERDNIKTQYCIDNNIRLLRIRYNQDIQETLITSIVA